MEESAGVHRLQRVLDEVGPETYEGCLVPTNGRNVLVLGPEEDRGRQTVLEEEESTFHRIAEDHLPLMSIGWQSGDVLAHGSEDFHYPFDRGVNDPCRSVEDGYAVQGLGDRPRVVMGELKDLGIIESREAGVTQVIRELRRVFQPKEASRSSSLSTEEPYVIMSSSGVSSARGT